MDDDDDDEDADAACCSCWMSRDGTIRILVMILPVPFSFLTALISCSTYSNSVVGKRFHFLKFKNERMARPSWMES